MHLGALKYTLQIPHTMTDNYFEDKSCEICKNGGEEDKILLCDKCDREFHMFCLRPKLTEVPEGEWLCPLCCPVGSVVHLSKKIKIQCETVEHTKNLNEQNCYSELSIIPITYDYVGTLIRIYSPEEKCYHSGRIIDRRTSSTSPLTLGHDQSIVDGDDDKEGNTTIDSFSSFEYLVQFRK